jgi:gamma-glutamylcyclotransferase (GGCT)/AIG2-like uncharacterized protein YtfP
VSRHSPSCILLAEARGLLVDLGGYPAMLQGHAGRGRQTLVQGEFVRFPDVEAALRELDAIEGAKPHCEAGALYRRMRVQVDVGDGRMREAWSYVTDDEQVLSRPVIASGCWREHQGRRQEAIKAIVTAHVTNRPEFFKALDAEARYLMAPEVPPPFELTIEGVTKAVMSREVSERKIARCSEEWSATITSFHAAFA